MLLFKLKVSARPAAVSVISSMVMPLVMNKKEEFDSVPWLPADQTILDVIRSSMQPVKPLHTSEYDKEPLQRC